MVSVDHKPLDGCRVLVAEDEAIQSLDMQDILTTAGARIVGPAPSVQVAMELAVSQSFDCAVMDVRLKGGYVHPVAEIVREMGRGIVFVTAAANTLNLNAEFPSAEILIKPSSDRDLIQAVTRVWKGTA